MKNKLDREAGNHSEAKQMVAEYSFKIGELQQAVSIATPRIHCN